MEDDNNSDNGDNDNSTGPKLGVWQCSHNINVQVNSKCW